MSKPAHSLLLVEDDGHKHYYRFQFNNLANVLQVLRDDFQGKTRDMAIRKVMQQHILMQESRHE